MRLKLSIIIDFADKSDLGKRLQAYYVQSPGEIGVANGEENVRPYAESPCTL
jgi:hypothetical protein